MVRRMTEHNVLIAGGGLTGLALGLALDQAGIDCVIVDPADLSARAPDFDGRAYAIALATRRMLEALGIWAATGSEAEAILTIRIAQGRAGAGQDPGALRFDHHEIQDGPMGHFLEDRFLRKALLDAAAAAPRVTLRSGVSLAQETALPGAIDADLSDGTQVRARLLVAADGRTSPVAARAGIRRLTSDYDQTSLVTAIEHELPHHGTAHQLFLPEGPLAILPLPGNRSSIVWTEARARAAEIAALPDAAYLALLRPRFGRHLGEISLTGARYSYP
ncbi:MAG: FAD-dependent monooxygenase, partial [Pseudomonadota bacterium]